MTQAEETRKRGGKPEMVTATSDIRFDVPLYTQTHAAHYLDMPPSTFRSWAQGYHNRFRNRPPVHGAPLITYLGEPHSPQPSIPFIGLAEGMFLSALRRADVPMQQIRPALELVRERLGVQYALASKRLYAVGAQLLFEVSEGQDLDRTERREARKLIVLKNGQYVFREVVEKYMRNIHYDDGDGYAARLHLPGYEVAEVMAEPQVNFGQPYFTATGTPLYAVAGRLRAGDTVEETAEDFDLPVDQVAELSERVERGVA